MASIFISDLWNTWNIRSIVILSLLLQVFLILFAPLRKKIANNTIILLLWLAYLMADSIVVYGIGLISHNEGNPSTHESEVNGAIQAFWASFLLLHLGGPDTITAFSLEDSSLWRRHLLSLIFQVSVAVYVFVHIFPIDESLVIPTMLVFFLGVIKNAERVIALHLSSLSRMRESMNPEDPDMRSMDVLSEELDEYEHSNEACGGACFKCPCGEAKLPESIVVKHAYGFFQIFKVFLVDLMFTLKHRKESYEYFRKVYPLDALRVISVELQFMYEMLHTKALAIRSKWSFVFRFIALNVLVVAFILFNRLKKHKLSEVDIKITYSLLFGGISLDMMALFMLVFSDWTVGEIMWHCTAPSKLNAFLHEVVYATDYLRKPRFAECEAEPYAGHIYKTLDTSLVFRRWSESISACNLFSEIKKESPRKMKKCNRGWISIAFSNICSCLFHMVEKITSYFRRTCEAVAERYLRRKTSMITRANYVSKNPFTNKLWIFIFAEVKRKSEHVFELTKDIFEARGDMFLNHCGIENLQEVNLGPYIIDCNYDSSISYLHIATEWWYHRERSIGRNELREFSKILSDYMMYLLLNQPNVMFAVAGNAQFTSGEILQGLRRVTDGDVNRLQSTPLSSLAGILHQRKDSPGFKLAEEIGKLGDRKWEVMSGLWAEMLCYAAGHIRGDAHAQVLSKGGELLSFVWLLMAHFGCLYKDPWGFKYDFDETDVED